MSKSNDLNILLKEVKDGINARIKNESREMQIAVYHYLWIDIYNFLKTEIEIQQEKERIEESRVTE